jgi:hypothetical protein
MSHAEAFARSTPINQQAIDPASDGSSVGHHTGPIAGSAQPGIPSEPATSTVSTRLVDERRGTGSRPGPTSTNFPAGLVSELKGYIAAFRDGRLSKPRTIAIITSKLDFQDGGTVDEPQKEAALADFLATIESVERQQIEAARRGAHAAAGLSRAENTQPTSAQVPAAPTGDVDQEVESLLESLTSSKRARKDEEDDSDGENGRFGSADGGESNKKRRLYERDMPWFGQELAARQRADPSCLETRRILGLLGNDVGAVKRWIQQSSAAPTGFPSSEWENIIRGNAVDLDKVFSSLHLVAPTKEKLGRVGSTTISLGDTEPARRIQTSGDWFAAWREATKATAFVFPHRRDELWDYADHINREFSAKVPSSHRKIILYDAAVRNAVGGGQSLLLTDYTKFNHIYSAIIPADGVGAEGPGRSSGSNARAGSRNRQSDICRRFNSESSNCPDGNTCKYKHICKRCKKARHGQHDCEGRKEGEGKTGSRA